MGKYDYSIISNEQKIKNEEEINNEPLKYKLIIRRNEKLKIL